MPLSNDMYSRLVESISAGAWIMDSEGKTLFGSERMAELLGTKDPIAYTLVCDAQGEPVGLVALRDDHEHLSTGLREAAEPIQCDRSTPDLVESLSLLEADNNLQHLLTEVTAARSRLDVALKIFQELLAEVRGDVTAGADVRRIRKAARQLKDAQRALAHALLREAEHYLSK
jgi:hypothetical protein